MQRRKSTGKLDAVQNSRRVVEESIGSSLIVEKQTFSLSLISQVMSAMGKKGGAKGGKRRLETLSDERRSEIASQAAVARWAKAKKKRKKAG
jgi:hypothetical protein